MAAFWPMKFRAKVPLGFQTLTFSRSQSGELIVDVHIEIDFKLGPIPLFRHLHDNREVWRDGVLLSMKSKTYNNGEDVTADLKLEDGQQWQRQPL